jgi:hypothetical protein
LLEKCYIKEVDVKIARKFLNETTYKDLLILLKLGLYYNEDLVSIMTFDNKRVGKDGAIYI